MNNIVIIIIVIVETVVFSHCNHILLLFYTRADFVNSINKPFCLFKCCTHTMTWQRLHVKSSQTKVPEIPIRKQSRPHRVYPVERIKKKQNKKKHKLRVILRISRVKTRFSIQDILSCGNGILWNHVLLTST